MGQFLSPHESWKPAFWSDPGVEVDTRDGDLAIAIAELAFSTQPRQPDQPVMVLDEWQKFIIRLALARDAKTGKRLYRQFLVSVGRQNGKSTLATAFVLWALLTRADSNVIGLASNAEQANIVYRRVLNIIRNSPSLSKRFTRLTETRALGTESGALYKVLPSKGAALQGHTVSLAIADEVHLMASDVYNAILIGAGQVPDSLLFSITTAGDENSALLLDLYAKLQEGTPGFGGIIWEADEGARVDDLAQLAKANPALAEGRMSPEQVLQEVSVLPEPEARRYRLNRFIAAENAWLPNYAWSSLPRVDGSPTNPVIVIDRTPDWSAATIAVAWKTGEQINAQVVASVTNPDLAKLTDLTAYVLGVIPGTPWMDGNYLIDLYDALKLRGYSPQKLVYRDAYNAPAVAYQKIMEGKVSHDHLPLVSWQLARTISKAKGDAYRLTRHNGTVEIDAAIAIVNAIYLAEIQQEMPLQMFVI